MSEKLPVLGSAIAQIRQGSTAANVLRAGVAALALNAVACGEEETPCHVTGTTPSATGGVDSYECTCYEGGDDEKSKDWYSASTNRNENGYLADKACIGVVNGINNPGGAGGSAGSTNNPTCYPSAEVCDGYDNDCDGYIDEGCGSGQPTCNPTTEVCDGYDNDCDGQIDEGKVCGSTPTSYGWEICWPTDKPSNMVDPNSYTSFARNNLYNTGLYCESTNYVTADYPGKSGTWIVRNRDEYCGLTQINVNGDGLKIGAATTDAGSATFNTQSDVQIDYSSSDKGCVAAFATDNEVEIKIQ